MAGKNIKTDNLKEDGSEWNNKHIDANQKRLQALYQQRQAYAERKNAISQAFKQLDDTSKVVNTKIRFTNDSDDEGDQSSKFSRKDSGNKGKTNLFDDDEQEVVEFFKPAFEGERGEKLLELQSRYNYDPRFRFDERFLDDENTPKNKESSTVDPERDKYMVALQKSLGRTVRIEEKTGRPINARYDPDNPEHKRYLTEPDIGDEQTEHSHRGGRKRYDWSGSDDEPEQDNGPEGMDSEFAQRLREKAEQQQPSNFSLRSVFGRDDSEPAKKQVQKTETKEVKFTPWQLELMRMEDSSDEEYADDPDEAEDVFEKAPAFSETGMCETFFILDVSDPRIAIDGWKFRRTETFKQMQSQWEINREGLTAFYKHLAKTARKRKIGRFMKFQKKTARKNLK